MIGSQGGPGWGRRSRRAAARLVPRRWGRAYLRKIAARPGAGPRSAARAMHGSRLPSSAGLRRGNGETEVDARRSGGDDLYSELWTRGREDALTCVPRGCPGARSRADTHLECLEGSEERQTPDFPHRARLGRARALEEGRSGDEDKHASSSTQGAQAGSKDDSLCPSVAWLTGRREL